MMTKDHRVRGMLRKSVRALQVVLTNIESSCHRDLATELSELIFNMQDRIKELEK